MRWSTFFSPAELAEQPQQHQVQRHARVTCNPVKQWSNAQAQAFLHSAAQNPFCRQGTNRAHPVCMPNMLVSKWIQSQTGPCRKGTDHKQVLLQQRAIVVTKLATWREGARGKSAGLRPSSRAPRPPPAATCTAPRSVDKAIVGIKRTAVSGPK